MEKCDDKMMDSGRRMEKIASIKTEMIRKFIAYAMHGLLFAGIGSSGATSALTSNGE